MPMIRFVCNNSDCVNEITKIFSNAKEIPPFLDCGECGIGKLERTLAAPATKSTQFIDNGLQSRKVEVSNDLIERERKRLGDK